MTTTEPTTRLRFFTFSQNNSGGAFVLDRDVRQFVVVEAPTARVADAIAETHGVYFEGVRAGRDCGCCGDRWSETYGEPADIPNTYGHAVLPLPDNLWAESDVVTYYADGRRVYGFSGSAYRSTLTDAIRVEAALLGWTITTGKFGDPEMVPPATPSPTPEAPADAR